MHRMVAAALVAALALVLASCGGGEKTQTVSRAEVVRRLESACRAGQREAVRQNQGRRGPIAFANAAHANLETVLDQIGDLETTGRSRADFDAYKAAVRVRLPALERIISADGADRQRVIAREEAIIRPATARGYDAIGRLGAEHVCL